jgi:tetratricopeptide (TPR) repeat protein/tRNA A-37 threonylcarbamoyl transferase component Bud32
MTDGAGAPTFQRYEVRECLGEGASASVYRAWDRELKRLVALKVLRLTTFTSGIAFARFRREAAATAGLRHPNVVGVYDAAEENGLPYLVLELVEGRSLQATLQEGNASKRDLLALLLGAARGVAAAHDKGIVHRDLKPANILVSSAGEAKVADFGLVHVMNSESLLTRDGARLGTPSYMSPEQVDGRSREVTPSTDVYALGAILYEILCGVPPHDGATLEETYAAILSRDPIPPRRRDPKIPAELQTIVLKALEKEPERRYAGAHAFADDLARHLAGEPIAAHVSAPWKRGVRRALRNRAVVGLAALLFLLTLVAGGTLALQSVQSRHKLEAEQALARRRQDALQQLGTLQSSMLSLQNDVRRRRVSPEAGNAGLDRVLSDVDRYVAEWPEQPQGYFVRARARRMKRDRAGALQDVRTALAKAPDFRPGWTVLGILKVEEYQEGFDGSARVLQEREKALKPVLDEAIQAFDKGWVRGRELEEAARWGLAWTREDQVLERLAQAFRLYLDKKNREGTVALLEEADREYEAEEYSIWLGLIATDPKERTRRTEQAVQRAPGFAQAYYSRGVCFRIAGDLRRAMEDVDSAIRLDPNYPEAHATRGSLRQTAGDLEGAFEDYTRALTLRPKMVQAWVTRGNVRTAQGKADEALSDYTQALELDPNSPDALLGRGNARGAKGDLKGAREDFDRALDIAPRSADILLSRGLVHLKENRFADAQRDMDRAIELNPTYLVAFETRGYLFETSGDLASAVRDYEQALRLAPAAWPRRPPIESALARVRARLPK